MKNTLFAQSESEQVYSVESNLILFLYQRILGFYTGIHGLCLASVGRDNLQKKTQVITGLHRQKIQTLLQPWFRKMCGLLITFCYDVAAMLYKALPTRSLIHYL